MKIFATLLFCSALAVAQTKPSAKSHTPGSRPQKLVSTHAQVAPDLDARLAKWKHIKVPFKTAGLTADQVAMVKKLAAASQYLDDIFWRQSDPEGLELYQALAKN